jgi:hypothetical protein
MRNHEISPSFSNFVRISSLNICWSHGTVDYCIYLAIPGYTWRGAKRVNDLDERVGHIVSNRELADLNTIHKIVNFVFFWAEFIPTELVGTKILDFSGNREKMSLP